MQQNDIVVMGSDGLLDNLYDSDIQTCLQPQVDHHGLLKNVQEAADCLAKKTEQVAYDPNYLSPFARAAIEASKLHTGGKPDDITVVVG